MTWVANPAPAYLVVLSFAVPLALFFFHRLENRDPEHQLLRDERKKNRGRR